MRRAIVLSLLLGVSAPGVASAQQEAEPSLEPVPAPTEPPEAPAAEVTEIPNWPPASEGPPPVVPGRKRPKKAAASAQEPAATAAPPPPSSATLLPSGPESAKSAVTGDARAQIQAQARHFFSRLIVGDARGIAKRSALPFHLESKRIDSTEALISEWVSHLRSKRADLLTLYSVEILTPDEMERRHGKPPARLQALPWRAPKTYIAVANLSGHAAIALYRDTGKGFQVVGYTD